MKLVAEINKHVTIVANTYALMAVDHTYTTAPLQVTVQHSFFLFPIRSLQSVVSYKLSIMA